MHTKFACLPLFYIRLAGKRGIRCEKVTIGIVVLVHLQASYQHHMPRNSVLLLLVERSSTFLVSIHIPLYYARHQSQKYHEWAQVVVLISCCRVSKSVVGHKIGRVDSKGA